MKKTNNEKNYIRLSDFRLFNKDKILSLVYYIPRNFISNMFYSIKYGFQRMFRGYDDREIFNLDHEFCKRYLKILEHLKQTHVGHPYNISDNDWETILQEMINHLDYIYTNMFEWENSDSVQKSKDNFMDLFKEYFFDLWN